MNDTFTVSALTGLSLLIIVHIGILMKNLRAMRQLATHDERLTHLSDALALLTDTSESGFRAVAAEMARLGAEARPSGTAGASNQRLASQARRGQTVQEIATAEGVSEGEVRLRLHLVDHEGAATAKGPRTPVAARTGREPAPAGRAREVCVPAVPALATAASDTPVKASARRRRADARPSAERTDGAVRE